MPIEPSTIFAWIQSHPSIFLLHILPLLLALMVGGMLIGLLWGYRIGSKRIPEKVLAEHWIQLRIRSLEESWCPVCGKSNDHDVTLEEVELSKPSSSSSHLL